MSMQCRIKHVKGQTCQYRKIVVDMLLLSSPNSTCKILSREIGEKIVVPNCRATQDRAVVE